MRAMRLDGVRTGRHAISRLTDAEYVDLVENHPDEFLARATRIDLTPLHEALAARQRADAEIVDLVRGLRAQGASWTSISTVLGISREAANERFDEGT